jgi:hypothetical protein
MSTINFDDHLIPEILLGKVTGVVRKQREHPLKVGQKVYAYNGARPKGERFVAVIEVTGVDKLPGKLEYIAFRVVSVKAGKQGRPTTKGVKK